MDPRIHFFYANILNHKFHERRKTRGHNSLISQIVDNKEIKRPYGHVILDFVSLGKRELNYPNWHLIQCDKI